MAKQSLAWGLFSAINAIPGKGIARLNIGGSLDKTFDPGLGTGTISIRTQITALVYAATQASS